MGLNSGVFVYKLIIDNIVDFIEGLLWNFLSYVGEWFGIPV